MPLLHRAWLAVAAMILFLALSGDWPGSALAQSASGPRVVAVGDIHGDFDAFAGILTKAGIINPSRRWIARNTVLVQLGDFTDRGPHVRAVMDFLIDLEKQARGSGSRVVVLLGNHETMNILGDLRYVTPEIYASFSDANSERRRVSAYEAHVKLHGAVDRAAWMSEHPVGFVEYQDAFGPRGRYGRWLREKPVVARIGDSVFLHGGLDPAQAADTVEAVNQKAAEEIKQFDVIRTRMIERKLVSPSVTFQELLSAAQAEFTSAVETLQKDRQEGSAAERIDEQTARDLSGLRDLLQIGSWSIVDPNGPLWFRGFATWPEAEGDAQLQTLIERYKISHFVVGHSITNSKRITPRFGNRVFLIDTGMSSSYVPGGTASALEITGNRFSAIYPNEPATLVGPEPVSAPAGR